MPKLSFSAGKKWKLVLQNEEIGYDGNQFYARKLFARKEELLNGLEYICSETSVTKFTSIVEKLIGQKHGTMLIISSQLKERLPD